ncbi:MAG: hypothetical protein F6J86_10715 [Symploca sp. SIO1B1]|nr:hypothetical protein [Symploca sp. SIO1A3]NER94294.1 hypothetical protein [Symploca sp. SIO1B1]
MRPLKMDGIKEFDFTTSVCVVELGKDRRKIVWVQLSLVNLIDYQPGKITDVHKFV